MITKVRNALSAFFSGPALEYVAGFVASLMSLEAALRSTGPLTDEERVDLLQAIIFHAVVRPANEFYRQNAGALEVAGAASAAALLDSSVALKKASAGSAEQKVSAVSLRHNVYGVARAALFCHKGPQAVETSGALHETLISLGA